MPLCIYFFDPNMRPNNRARSVETVLGNLDLREKLKNFLFLKIRTDGSDVRGWPMDLREPANKSASVVFISSDGKQIGFVSYANNLTPNVNNETANVFAGESPFVCTQNSDCPPGTVCREGVCSPFQCDTSADCGTSGRETCVNHSCECTGDCNLDQMVTPTEVETCVQIFGEELPVSACPAADQDGSGTVTPVEVEIAVENFGLGCPPRVH